MAERRMISKSISVSERVNGLSDTFHMLLFTWMVPHADDFGRLFGSPMKIKALVVPMLDKTLKDVEEALSSLCREGLIQWYEVGGDQFIQIDKFDRHQTGLHKRTKSKFPEPPGNSGNFPEIPSEEKRTEENRTEEKGREVEEKGREKSPAATDEKPLSNQIDPFAFYEQNIGRLSPTIRQAIDCWYEDFPQEVIIAAMNEAVVNNKGNWGYANSCLQSWFNKGAKTLDDVKAIQVEFERSKGGYKANGQLVNGDASSDSRFGNLDQFVIR
ncbi:DnaD domain-containing protein [Brevibacillus porteri]|uniref:DnaD domain-containing protein n=1 Tax=Brevibacillus porteri TaxID=2126350 RepID=UPI0036410569